MLFLALLSLLHSFPAFAVDDAPNYIDLYRDRHQHRYYKANEGRYYEWFRPELSDTSICMELDSETHGEQYRMLVEDVYCPKIEVTHEWSKPGHGGNSRCMKVDLETHGQKFKRLSFDERCRKPKSLFAWIKTENDRKESCYEIDTETRGTAFRLPAREGSCPHLLNPYVAFGRYEPLVEPAIPYQDRAGRTPNRMPASLSKPVPAEEEQAEGPGEGIRKYWEDPEDLVRHVPDASRKGY